MKVDRAAQTKLPFRGAARRAAVFVRRLSLALAAERAIVEKRKSLMTYGDLIRLYFERSTALQWYWTLYVIVIGGLLAFSSLRQRPDVLTAALVTVLYLFFAYKNLGAIRDVTMQRIAVMQTIDTFAATTEIDAARNRLEPTLVAPAYEGVRNFHVASDLLTIAAVWAMEWRRRRNMQEQLRLNPPRALRTAPD